METEASSARGSFFGVSRRVRLRESIERALLVTWEDVPNERGARLAVMLAVWGGVVLMHGLYYPWSTAGFDDTPILALADRSLYARDFFVQEMLQFTPRYYYHRLVAAATEALGSIVVAQGVFGFAATGLAVAALLALGRALKMGVAGSGILAFLLLTVHAGSLGYYRTIVDPITPTPATLAGAVMVCGLPFVVKRRWNYAFLCFALSCLLQVLVGLFAIAATAPALVLDLRGRRWTAALIPTALAASGVAAVIVPVWLAQTSSSGQITAAQFVHLFAYVGFPMHLLPSAWPASMWIGVVLFYAGGLLVVRTAKVLTPRWELAIYAAVGVAALCIAFNAFGTLLVPIPAAAKLCLSRAASYAQAAVLIGLGVILGKALAGRQFVAAAALAAGASVPLGGAALLVVSAYWDRLCAVRGLHGHRRHFVSIGVGLIAMSSLVSLEQFSSVIRFSGLNAGLFLVLTLPALLFTLNSYRRRLFFAVGVTALIWSSIALGVARLYPPPLQALSDRQIDLREARVSGPYELARIVRQQTHKDALFLVPPDLTLFRFLSRRAVVVDAEAFPHTDRGILEWARRLETIFGQSLVGSLRDARVVEEGYRQRTLAELLTAARALDADYIVTDVRWHHPSPEQIAYRAGSWACIPTGLVHGR